MMTMSSTSLGSRLASVAVAALALAGCGVIGVLPASAQTATTGNISGYLRDSSGSAVPSGTVTARMTEQQLVRTTESNEEGFYSFQALPPGTYTLTFEGKGFQRQVQTGVLLTINQNLRADAALQVG